MQTTRDIIERKQKLGRSAEIGGNYHWCADSSSLPTLSHPLISLAFNLSADTLIPVSVTAPENITTPLCSHIMLKCSPADCNTMAPWITLTDWGKPIQELLAIIFSDWKHIVTAGPSTLKEQASFEWVLISKMSSLSQTKQNCCNIHCLPQLSNAFIFAKYCSFVFFLHNHIVYELSREKKVSQQNHL